MGNSNLCYCTNVAPGTDEPAIRERLDTLWARVRDTFCPGEPLGLGLWLPSGVSMSLKDPRFAVRTLNGFPYGDFHDEVVKHAVYAPTWADGRRSDYTWTLAAFLGSQLEAGAPGSISTVPLGWKLDEGELTTAGEMLRGLAVSLDEVSQNTGKSITIDLEPEPGCVLDRSADVVEFFNRHLNNTYARAHIGVCHDVCHASVMFEGQRDALKAYADAGIRVNKVQISSAPRAEFGSDPAETLAALRAFHEERYLHQTCARSEDGEVTFYEDLPLAMERSPVNGEEWRTHFHVPVYLDSISALSTSQGDILECMDACAELGLDPVWEVETYAWNVLPEAFRDEDLAAGIAKELAWTRDRLAERGLLK